MVRLQVLSHNYPAKYYHIYALSIRDFLVLTSEIAVSTLSLPFPAKNTVTVTTYILPRETDVNGSDGEKR